MKKAYMVFAAAVAACGLWGEVRLASPFNDGMVLQRERQVAVWGTAAAGERVTVTFAGQTVSTAAGADGRWLVRLAPMEASDEGRELKANGVSVKDVLVGEVWLCSGQSNMAIMMWAHPEVVQHGGRDNNGYLDAMIVDEPSVRACTVPNVWSAQPKELAAPLKWERFAPGRQKSFSALAFHYALTLRRTLRVPVGVIVSAWGGTLIEPWISPDGYRSVPKIASLAGRPIDMNRDHQQPRAIWNAMIHPLVPYTFRGALWYQGESNVKQGLDMDYKNYLTALRNGWAKAFEIPDMPFYLVQLAPFYYWTKPGDPKATACGIWEAEEAFARETPGAGMATTVDVGETDNIHPGDKRTVALRLAALALNRVYGRKDVPCDNPALKSCAVKGGTVTLTFDHVRKWVMHGLEPAPFEIAGPDGVFKPASVKFLDGAVEVRAVGVSEPRQVRYMWNWHGRGRLKNDYGFPLPPFFVRSLSQTR